MIEFKTEEILREIDKVSVYISDKLQLPIERAYDIMMKQCWFDLSVNILWVVIGILLLLSLILWYKGVEKYSKLEKEDREYSYSDEVTTCYIGYIVCLIFGLIFILHNLQDILQIIINPEWYMIQKIVTLMNSGG